MIQTIRTGGRPGSTGAGGFSTYAAGGQTRTVFRIARMITNASTGLTQMKNSPKTDAARSTFRQLRKPSNTTKMAAPARNQVLLTPGPRSMGAAQASAPPNAPTGTKEAASKAMDLRQGLQTAKRSKIGAHSMAATIIASQQSTGRTTLKE